MPSILRMIEDVRDSVEGLKLLVICTTASRQTRLHIEPLHWRHSRILFIILPRKNICFYIAQNQNVALGYSSAMMMLQWIRHLHGITLVPLFYPAVFKNVFWAGLSTSSSGCLKSLATLLSIKRVCGAEVCFRNHPETSRGIILCWIICLENHSALSDPLKTWHSACH